MLGIMLEKMWHKRWMNISLLLGCILLVATAVSFPLYEEAAYTRMLKDEFNAYVSQTGKWPAVFNMSMSARRAPGGGSLVTMENFSKNIYGEVGVKEKETSVFYYFSRNDVHSEMVRSDRTATAARFGAKTGMEDHVTIVSGEMYSPGGLTEDGAIEAVISQNCMVDSGFLVGETIVADNLKDVKGNPLRFYIKGIFVRSDDNDYYWQDDFGYVSDMLMMNYDLFKTMFTGENAEKYTILCRYTSMFEYADITADRIDSISERTDYFLNRSSYTNVIAEPPFLSVIKTYNNKHLRIAATLRILQIPVLIMLAAFLLMISGQMYEMEKSEISVIKSRGSSRAQIFRLYLYQSLVLTFAGAFIGIPLGMLLSRLLGAARTFLTFDFSDKLDVRVTPYSGAYALGAVLVALLCLTIPAIKHSKVSIVNLKQQNALKKKPLWEKLFIDVIFTGVAFYGYYNFKRNSGNMAESVLNNKSLDPLLYLSSSLMIIGLGLFFLRIKSKVIKLIYIIGKKHWKPASFVSFMENIKNSGKQQLIMLFLIMTVSLGMYHSTVAGTIVENAVKNTDYIDGVDLVLKESWPATVDSNGVPTGKFREPDSSKYVSASFVKDYTKVIFDPLAKATGGSKGTYTVTLMGINTKEFGGITYVDKYLNNKHYFTLLNELAEVSNGAIVSSNFRDKLGYNIGDRVNLKHENGKTGNSVVVLDFFDYWPGYAAETLIQQPDGKVYTASNYLVVANIGFVSDKLDQYPYEMWISTRDGYKKSDILNWIDENKVRLKKYRNRDEDLSATKSDPLLQGTNGVLSMGFVVTLVLCAVGYLIYWIMSLKERELVFGVLRASGFHMRELFHMLFNEQVFCGILSIAAGFGIGTLTSALFVPILQKAYATEGQVLPLILYSNMADLVRLMAVILGVMVLCLVVLTVMLLRMNVTKALKLGED